MPTAKRRKLTIEQAACLIFQTENPSPKQVGAVADLIARGSLEGERQGHWSTSTEAVAKYMAAASMHKKHAAHAGRPSPPSAAETARSGGNSLQPVYRDLLKDYFLAVLRRRSSQRKSQSFDRAVLGGQIVLVVGILTLFVWLAWTAGGPAKPAELLVVERWLEENMDFYRIDQWFPPEPSGGGASRIRVRYEYSFGNRKRVQTDRVFTIQDGQVANFTTSDD